MWPSGNRRGMGGGELVEIVTPRTNTAIITPAENLLAAISLPQPFSLEIAGTRSARRFLVRAGNSAMRQHLEAQVSVAYPQAELRRLDVGRYPGLDPARLGPDEQVRGRALVLRAPPYLPLRTFRDAEVDAAHNAQADPVLGLLGALHDLPEGWRGLIQLVLRPVPDDWCRPYLRLAVEHPLASERAKHGSDTSLTQVFALAALLGIGALAFQVHQWYAAHDWLHLALLTAGILAAIPLLLWLVRRRTRRPIYDMRLVQDKVSRIAYQTQIRLAMIAPASASTEAVEERLQRLVAAYRQFNLAAGNGLVAHRLDLRRCDLGRVGFLSPVRAASVLNIRELAGLWHLPQAGAEVPLVERTTARRRLPLPVSVAQGCPTGVSSHQGRTVPVSIPDEVLRRHLLLVAKTRRGKSSLLLHLAQHIMQAQRPDSHRPALVLIDPHRDLARAALGLVPPERRDAVVYLDVAERDRPFGLNLLDVGLGWERDKAVANALAIFRREFGGFWGPRMEDAFRFALLTLYAANQTLCKEPAGRARQHTILEIPALLTDPPFRESVLKRVSDPVISGWWSGYFLHLDRRLQSEVSNPVLTKVNRYLGNAAARSIVGQPRSTIDPLSWLPSGSIVIVNTARGTVGEDTAALLGATLLNLVALAIAEQANLDPKQRHTVTLLVDEFHTLPGTDYESILAELAKYGANLVLATQSLARLDALDREHHRSLRSMVFANLDGLFAFHTSAEDARYLVPELGEEIDRQDLVALGEHQCYVKLSVGGERLPTFSVQLDPPPTSDPDLCHRLATASAARYGRDRTAVERDLRSTLARIEASHGKQWSQTETSGGKEGTPDHGKGERKREHARNEHRNQTSPAERYQQGKFAGLGADEARPARGNVPEGDAERSETEGTEDVA